MDKREQIQKEAVETFIPERRGILRIAQRVGKIKIGLMIIEKIYSSWFVNPRILIAYPDNRIKDSWLKDMSKWNFKMGECITFCNYSSIHKYKNVCFDMIILDEIHATSDNQRYSIGEIATTYTLGLSGTVSSDTEKELKEQLGLEVLMSYTVAQAIEDDIIAPYEITVHLVELDTIRKESNKKGKMVSEKQKYDAYTWVFEKLKDEGKDYKFIVLHRNRVLQNSYSKRIKTINLIKEYSDKKTMVFTGLKKVSESLGIPFYHSTSDDPTVFEDFKQGKITQCAVVNIGRAGVTFDELEVIIINSFTGNEETTEQIIARALNKDKKDKVADIHIVCSTETAELNKLRKTLTNFENIYYA